MNKSVTPRVTGNPDVMMPVKSSRLRQLIAFSSCFIRRPGWRKPDCHFAHQRKWTLCDQFGFACAFSVVRFEQRKPRIGGDFRKASGNNSRNSLHVRLRGGADEIRTCSTVSTHPLRVHESVTYRLHLGPSEPVEGDGARITRLCLQANPKQCRSVFQCLLER